MRTLITLAAILLPSASAADMASAVQDARAGKFDATGEVACAQEVGQPFGLCRAKIARVGDSAAAVVVVFPNGFERALMFDDRAFVRGNATMSGVGTDMDWHLTDGVYRIRVDDQRFEIPETLVFGE